MRGWWGAALMVLLVGSAGCELAEVTVVEVEPIVVAEVYVQLGFSEGDRVTAWLHQTLGGDESTDLTVPGARIILRRETGGSAELGPTDVSSCATVPRSGAGTCYWLPSSSSFAFMPGDRIDLTIELPDGRTMISESTVPGDFSLEGIEEGLQCMLPPDTPMQLTWSSSPGTWAYVNETTIFGLQGALAARGVEIDDEDDIVQLLGLSISAADTTVVFPGEFGIFDRFELDQAIATALQDGLPEGARAVVTIAATDRNFVNWARGGNFNPSGQVRVGSIQGDGAGVFGTSVVRLFEVFSGPDAGQTSELPACPTG